MRESDGAKVEYERAASSPGAYPARMLWMCTGLFSTAASAAAFRSICPPPSSWLPVHVTLRFELLVLL